MFDVLTEHWSEFSSGFWVTVRLVVFAFAIAMVVGTFVAALRIAPNKWLSRLGGIYVEVFRNVPLLVLLFISYAGLRRGGLDVSAWVAGIGSLGLYTAAYVAEALRSGVFSVGKGQIEAVALARLHLLGRRCGGSCCRRPSGRSSRRWAR